MNFYRFICIVLVCSTLCTGCTRRGGQNNVGQTTPAEQVKRSRQNPILTSSTSTIGSAKYSGSDIFAKYNTAVFMVYTSDGWNEYQGSGFFINSNGTAVSNYHVFKGTGIGYEQLKLSDGKCYKIKEVIAKNIEHDFIIFKVDIPTTCNYIPITSRQGQVGDRIYTIGSPQGLENTFSSGEISQFREDGVIQISAPIDHGSSGGALINEYGEVIGITSAGLDQSGANLNFAIDIRILKSYIR